MDCCNKRGQGMSMPNRPANMDCGCGVPPTTIPPIMPRPQMERMKRPDPMNCMKPVNPMNCMNPARTMDSQKPIAMAYVPCQIWNDTYPLEIALSKGTIFPELDLPFLKGRC